MPAPRSSADDDDPIVGASRAPAFLPESAVVSRPLRARVAADVVGVQRAKKSGPTPAPQFNHAAGSGFQAVQGFQAVVVPAARQEGRTFDKTLLHRLPKEVVWVFEAAAQLGLRPEALTAAVRRYHDVAAAGRQG